MLVSLKIPPGIVIAGTPYQSKGVWLDGNLVRFFERSIRPVGGWELVADISEPARGIHAWRSNDSKARLILGTGDKVWAYVDGNLTEITPGTFGALPPIPPDPNYTPKKYGVGSYGVGKYGSNGVIVPPSNPTDSSIPLVADDDATWVFDNFGEKPIGVMSSDGRIRSWDLDPANDFEVISPLAPECRAVVVTPERFLLAIGAISRAQAFLVFGSIPLDGEQITVGANIYTFLNTITTADGDVLIGATIEDSITNLAAAINQTAGGAGSLYGDLTVAQPDVIATADTGDLTLIVTARVGGTPGNGIAVFSTVTDALWTTPLTIEGQGSPCDVQWPSRETLDDWVITSSNTAGKSPLSTVGRGMNGKRMPRETLIWTDTDLHSAVYIGGEDLYTFEWRGDKCGAIAPNAMVVIGDSAFWMSDNGFFRYDGSVSEIPCDIHDFVFRTINKEKAQRVYAVSVSQFGEVWWFYPTNGSEEVNAYAVFNYKENHWSKGTLSRVAGVDRGVFLVPIMVDPTGQIWKQETGSVRTDADPVFLESGPTEIEEGNNVWMIRRLVPDEANLGAVQVFVAPTFYPTDPPVFYGPFNPLQPTSLRLTGRQMLLKIQESAVNSDFRVGVFRADVVQAGER